MFDLPTSGSPRVAAMIRQSFGPMTHQSGRGCSACTARSRPARPRVLRVLRVRAARALQAVRVGLTITAYTLGLRHAFDADHISAIDNTTRKYMNERKARQPRPFGFGYFFSLGHSTIVVAIGVGIVIAEKTVLPAVTEQRLAEQFGGTFGTIVSASSCS